MALWIETGPPNKAGKWEIYSDDGAYDPVKDGGRADRLETYLMEAMAP